MRTELGYLAILSKEARLKDCVVIIAKGADTIYSKLDKRERVYIFR